MLCTLVIAIGTFPYALRAVAIPWSLDQDNSEQSSIRQHTRACYGLAALNEALQGSLQARLLALNEAHPRAAAAVYFLGVFPLEAEALVRRMHQVLPSLEAHSRLY